MSAERASVPTVQAIMKELESLGTEQTRKTFARHGATGGKLFGVRVGDLKKVQKFYTERLGFEVTDYYRGRGVFLRCRTPGGHHNLFFLGDESGMNSLNHLAFGVAEARQV